MNKALSILTLFVVALLMYACGGQKNNNASSTPREVAVICFSATGNTMQYAKKLAENLQADLIEISPKTPYVPEDFDWKNENSRSSIEMKDEACRPDIQPLDGVDLSPYRLILLGYPIWWDQAPRIINTFLDQAAPAIEGKIIVPFVTSGSSKITNSVKKLSETYPSIKWQSGVRMNDLNDEEFTAWSNEQLLILKADETGYIVKVGEEAPDFTITLTDGTQTTLSSLRGKVVMLQFTASWCVVCRREMPFIESDIWQKHKDNENFVLMGIDRDEPLETVQSFAEQTGITYPLGLDPGADIYAKYALRESGITRNCLIDADGKIVKLTRLYNEEEFQSLVSMIDELLAK